MNEKIDDKNMCLIYKIQEDNEYNRTNKKYYYICKKMLKKIGIHILEKDSEFSMNIDIEQYKKAINRNAGRKKKTVPIIVKEKENIEFKEQFVYRFSDIVFMLNFMNNTEIMKKLNMNNGTYYRRKKFLYNSLYYKSIDFSKIKDKEYLESLDGNEFF